MANQDPVVQMFLELEPTANKKKRNVVIERVRWTHIKDKRPRYWITLKSSTRADYNLPNLKRDDLVKLLESIDELEANL
jgi:hypothetical protein